MDAKVYWDLFMKTGSPEAYLLFNRARKVEEEHVFDHTGACPAGNGLQ